MVDVRCCGTVNLCCWHRLRRKGQTYASSPRLRIVVRLLPRQPTFSKDAIRDSLVDPNAAEVPDEIPDGSMGHVGDGLDSLLSP